MGVLIPPPNGGGVSTPPDGEVGTPPGGEVGTHNRWRTSTPPPPPNRGAGIPHHMGVGTSPDGGAGTPFDAPPRGVWGVWYHPSMGELVPRLPPSITFVVVY